MSVAKPYTTDVSYVHNQCSLEAATSRLEDITIAQSSAAPLKRDNYSIDSQNDSLQSPPPPPPPPPPPAQQPAQMAEVPRSLEAFDRQFVEDKLKKFVDLTKSLGSPLLTEQVRTVVSIFLDRLLKLLLARRFSTSKPLSKT